MHVVIVIAFNDAAGACGPSASPAGFGPGRATVVERIVEIVIELDLTFAPLVG